MNREQLRRIGIALGVLLAVWIGLRLIQGVARDARTTLPRPSLDRAAVDGITIARPGDTIRLTRTGAAWTVNGFAASASAITELLDAVADTSGSSELVAETAATHVRLGVDSAQARRVEVRRGADVVLAYLVGKRGPSFESGYVRRPDEDRVFQVRGRLVELVERRVDDWRDRRIVSVEPDSLTGVEITLGSRGYALARSDSGWRLPGGELADSGAVASLLSQFRLLEASGFASPAEADSARFEAPERRIRLLGPGSAAVTLALDSIPGGFWVRRDTLPTVYRLDSWTADRLTPADSTLRRRPAPTAP